MMSSLDNLRACSAASTHTKVVSVLLKQTTLPERQGPSDEPRRVQVLDLYCLTRFESEGSSKGIVY